MEADGFPRQFGEYGRRHDHQQNGLDRKCEYNHFAYVMLFIVKSFNYDEEIQPLVVANVSTIALHI